VGTTIVNLVAAAFSPAPVCHSALLILKCSLLHISFACQLFPCLPSGLHPAALNLLHLQIQLAC
jgi:hypothetical protein